MRFSIVTVSLNSERTISDTLRSVASQSFDDYEHIVVDGASRDGTLDLVRRHPDPRLRLISEPDDGFYDAMNKGARAARGDYVIFLNSTDYFCRSDALELAARRLDETGADCLFADTQFVEEDGVTERRRVYSVRRFRRWWLRIGAMPPHPSMFVRRTRLLESGGFDVRYRIAADFDLTARLLLDKRATWAVLPVSLTNFRVGGVSTSGLRAKATVSSESADSLRRLGQPFARLAVQLRFPLKLTQFRLRRARTG